MIDVTYKKKWLKINAVWFCEDMEAVVAESKADLVFFHRIDRRSVDDRYSSSAIINKQHSLITDLKAEPDELFQRFNKNYRYEINRANKEGIQCVSYLSEELRSNPEVLALFEREYSDFVKSKGIANAYNKSAMNQYIAHSNVLLTRASKDGRVCAQHIYLHDKSIARLLYSVSNFRTEGLDPSLVGRANKYLHWYDIQYLWKEGIEILDWGGISSIENPNGVDRFKKGFGGEECTYYNVIIGRSISGRLAVSIIKLKRG